MRVVKVDSEVRRYSDITFTYVVPVVEVYLNAAAADTAELAALAPPWSADALARAGADGGSGQAGRRRVLGRGGAPARACAGSISRATRRRARQLGAILDGLARQNYVPEALKRLVAADEAQARWAALRQFAQRRGHYLVTNGPYQLEKWTDGAVVLERVPGHQQPARRRQLRSLRDPAACLRYAHHRARRPPRDRAGDRAAGEVPPGVPPRPRAAGLPRARRSAPICPPAAT